METFRYSLDRSSKKHICPNCTKKTFVLYIDTTTGEYLPTDFGRCDREQKCGHRKTPPKGKKAYLIDFLALTSISDKAFKLVDLNGIISLVPKSQILEQTENKCFITEWYLKTSTINYLNCETKYFNTDEVAFVNEVKNVITPESIKPSYHSLELLDKMYVENSQIDNLTEFLKTQFSKDEVFKATQKYFITGTNHRWERATIFWQIDQNENIRGAKIMLYDSATGKRIKKPYNHISWLHKHIKEPNFELKQCLFGLHLINFNPDDLQKEIAICESEKSAIMMSIFLPQYIWLATGSKGNFKFEMLEPIKKRNIIAFPDKGEYNSWLNKATELSAYGFKIVVSDLIENTEFENGFDLADYYLHS
jgi:hypothetical protein